MEKDIQEILLTEEQINTRIAELGKELTADYAGKDPIIVGVLKGVVVFYADMIREIKTHCEMDFMWISSYAGTNSTGKMEVKRDIASDIKGRHVLILEDIYDTGNSLDFTYRHLLTREPASLKICTLLDKPERRQTSVKSDYVGFVIPDEFVVGYGLDYAGHYRNLPYIGCLLYTSPSPRDRG